MLPLWLQDEAWGTSFIILGGSRSRCSSVSIRSDGPARWWFGCALSDCSGGRSAHWQVSDVATLWPAACASQLHVTVWALLCKLHLCELPGRRRWRGTVCWDGSAGALARWRRGAAVALLPAAWPAALEADLNSLAFAAGPTRFVAAFVAPPERTAARQVAAVAPPVRRQ